MTHEDYKELLAGYALTALDAAEAVALEVHLESCADCRAELSEWEATTAFLALEAEPLEPPAQLRASILASVIEDREASAVRAASADLPVSASRSADPGRSASVVQERESVREPASKSTVLPFVRPERNLWTSLGSIGAIAAMLVCAVSIIWLLSLWQQNRTMKDDLARVSREMRQMEEQLRHEREVVQLLTSPDAHMAKLSGTNMAPGAHAMLAFDKSGHAMLMTNGLPAAPAGMAYQLWYIKDNKKMPGKVFTPDAAGNGMLEDQVPAVAREAAVYAVTLEPESGVQAPTGSIYLVSAS